MRLAWLLMATVGCGSAAGEALPDAGSADARPAADAGPGELDTVDLAPAPGWPAEVTVRSVPALFRTYVIGLEVAPDGKIWLLRDEIAAPMQLFGTPVLERYAPGGHLERRVSFPAHALVTGFVVHPSGQLTAFVQRDDDGDTQHYTLELRRLSPDGETVTAVTLSELPGAREHIYYDGDGPHELPADLPFELAWSSHVVGLPDGEGLFLLAEWTYGHKLYRLDEGYGRTWGAQVMPANLGNVFQFSPSLLARDEQGRVVVATQLFEEDAPIYGQHFGRPALAPIGSYDVLVQRFEAGGAFSAARLIGGAAIDHPSALVAHDGNVLVAGAARVTKHDQPNRTMEWDVALYRASLDDAVAPEVRYLDLARDDFGWAMAETADGGLVVGGRTDYVQVDTNSEVEDGKGLFLTVGADLARKTAVELAGPRDVQVRALRLLPGGDLVFAGTRNGPLTHTDPAMSDNDGVWGIVHLGNSASR